MEGVHIVGYRKHESKGCNDIRKNVAQNNIRCVNSLFCNSGVKVATPLLSSRTFFR